MNTLRIGSGAGYSGDRIEPAVELAEHGDLDYLVFECLAERTIALAQQARISDPQGGYDPLLSERMRRVLPFVGRREGLKRIHIDHPGVNREIGLISRSGMGLSPAAQRCFDLLNEELSDTPSQSF